MRHFGIESHLNLRTGEKVKRSPAHNKGMHTLNTPCNHECSRTFPHNLIGNPCAAKFFRLRDKKAVERFHAPTLKQLNLITVPQGKGAARFHKRFNKRLHRHSVPCLRCSTNVLMRLSSAGMSIPCGQWATHFEQPMQWSACRSFGTERS